MPLPSVRPTLNKLMNTPPPHNPFHRSAELHSAVSPVCNRRSADTIQRLRPSRRLAGCNPALRQSATLRYAKPARNLWLRATLSALFVGICLNAHAAEPAPIRAGMIGLDTSHVPAFAKLFNNPKATGDVSGIRIVAGYPGGTDYPASRDRVKGFTEGLRTNGVEIVDTIPKLLEKVDVVLIESVDGRIHLQEAIPVIKAGKPLFLDKPVAGSLADAIAIYELAKKHNVPCFSSSSLRFGGIQELAKNPKLGTIVGAITWYSCSYQEGTPDLFFYGVHGVEPLYVLMGLGCETVTRVRTTDTDVVTGVWKDGRVGTYRGIRKNNTAFGAVAFGTKAIIPIAREGGYAELCQEIGRFFKTGKAPVSAEETIEIFAFMEAADESKRQGGAPVSLAAILAKARAEAAVKIAK
jgi:hypothetical protein